MAKKYTHRVKCVEFNSKFTSLKAALATIDDEIKRYDLDDSQFQLFEIVQEEKLQELSLSDVRKQNKRG